MANELTAPEPRAGRVPAVRRSIGRRSIGRRSQRLKRRHYLRRLGRAVIGAAAVLIGAMVVGFVVNGLGLGGVMVTAALTVAVFLALLFFPAMRAPSAAQLRGSDLSKVAGRAELFLEAQRPLLPPPAQQLIDGIGLQLDQLAPQLETLGERDPAADEVRRLLGEHLPGLIESYRRIPEALRREDHAGATPEQQLVGGLEVIAREIEAMTGQIARGELDALATRGRYLETKYVTGPDGSGA